MIRHNGTGRSVPLVVRGSSATPKDPAAAFSGSGEAQTATDRQGHHVAAQPVSAGDRAPVERLHSGTSVIGPELSISGREVHIVSMGKIRVEGKIRGDIRGTEVVIGDVGEVEGVVSGDKVKVYGAIMGAIRGVQVEIEAGAKVEADVHHHSLSVDANAQIEGRLCRVRNLADLQVVTAASGDQVNN